MSTHRANPIVSVAALALLFGCDLDLDPEPVGKDTELPESDSGSDGTKLDVGHGMTSTSGGDGGPMLDVGGGATTDAPLDVGGGGETDEEMLDIGGGQILDVGGELGDDCDPVVQGCLEGEACYPSGDGFSCDEVDPEPGAAGDACMLNAECGAGTFCDVDLCRAFCDTEAAECPNMEDTCEAWPDPPPGSENVGTCS